MFCAEGPVKVHLNDAHLFSAGVQVIHNFLGRIADTSHCHKDFLGIRCTIVIKGFVGGADFFVHHVHVFHDDVGGLVIGTVAGLPVLEEGLGLLSAAD